MVDPALNITANKFKQLTPSVRFKRGLINPLGSLVKAITGNLDNDDAVMYEKLIQEIELKQNNLDRKMIVVSEMLGTFSKIANSTKGNFIQIEQSIQDISRTLNESRLSQFSNKLIHLYDAFIHNFQILYLRLNEIETSIAFAKVNLLHQSVIDTDELIELLHRIEITDKLVFPVNAETIVKIEQCIEIKAYVKQNQIKLIMHIPLVTNETFNYFKLVPLPIYNNTNGVTSLILPKYPFILVKGLKATPLSQPCREVDEARFLCFENDVTQLIEDHCTAELMKFSTNISNCHPVPVTIDDVRADLIQPNRWILYSKRETLLTKYCGDEIEQEVVSGTYLLTIDDSCTVKIKQITLRRHQTQGRGLIYTRFPVINLPQIRTTSTDMQKRPVNLEGIDLGDTQFLNLLLQKSGSFSDSEKPSVLVHKSVSLSNLILCVLAITGLVLLAFKSKVKKMYFKFRGQVRDRPHPSGNLDLEEGGVMLGAQPYRSTHTVIVPSA